MLKPYFVILLFHPFVLSGQSAFLDSIRQDLKGTKGSIRIERLYEIAKKNTHASLSDARVLAEEGIQLAQSLNEKKLEVKGYLLLADLLLDLAEPTRADSIILQAITLAESIGNVDLILDAKYSQSKILGRLGKRNEAILQLKEIQQVAIDQGDTLMQARALMGIGINHEKLSAFESALQSYYQALPLYKAVGDDYRIGITHTNIGMSFLGLDRNQEALEEFQNALRICEQQADIEGIMINTLNTGVAYQRLRQFDLATAAFQKSLATARKMGSWFDIALLTANLGTTAMDQGKYAEARVFLERACVLKDSLGFQSDIAHTLNSLAKAHYYLKEYDKAAEKAKEAMHLAQQYQQTSDISESHRILSDVYAVQNNFASAFDHLRRHKELNDSVFSEESDKAISNLKIQYETSLKEAQITDLTRENKRRKTTQIIYLGIAFLILLTGASIIYALYLRRTRDKMILAKERELHELQNRFFANISHEFRTPLTLILGPAHNLRRQFKGTSEESALRTIQKNAERLLMLINQILDLTKFDQKALELKKETFNITRMVEGICSSFDSLAEDRGIDFRYDIAENLTLTGDIRRLEVVLINLVSNAFKFTPDKGSIRVTAGINKTADAFTIQVRDSGSGIPAENLPRIFDRYYHDDRDAHSDFEGAGIGLALSKHIVDMHGGQISVSSKINEGTVFTVSLPYTPVVETHGMHVLEVQHETISAPQTIPVVDKELATNGEMPIVLLVEDRKDMREYITALLRRNYHVIEAPDAFQGREKAMEHIPDIIISDVMMPRKNGLELCRELKTDMRTSHIPVILLTAKSSPEDRLSGLETEADIYLTKPFIPEELELHLRNLIASRRKIREFYASHHRIEPAKMSFNSVDAQFLDELSKQLELNHPDETFGVEQLADLMHLSRSQLNRKLTALTGHSPNKLIRTYRLKRAYDMISSNTATISEIAFNTGFSSAAYFNKCFVEEFGSTPGEIRNKHANSPETKWE